MSLNNHIARYVQENILPNDLDNAEVAARYKDLSEILDSSHAVSFQSGSYARATDTRPLHDLDVIWELPGDIRNHIDLNRFTLKAISPYDLDITNPLESLKTHLEKEYKNYEIKPTSIDIQGHSIILCFGDCDEDFSIDVVPAVKLNEPNGLGDYFYAVPEIQKLNRSQRASYREQHQGDVNWIRSDPKGYKQLAVNLNDQHSSFFSVSARFLKEWKNRAKRGREIKIRSFHIEQIVVEEMGKLQVVDDKFLPEIFQNLLNYFQTPIIRDRANTDLFVDDYLEEYGEEERRYLSDLASDMHRLLLSLSDTSSYEEVANKLDDFFTAQHANHRPSQPTVTSRNSVSPWSPGRYEQ